MQALSRVLMCLVAIVAATLSLASSAQEKPVVAVASPHFVVHLPPLASDETVAYCEAALATLEPLALALDAEWLGAKAVKKRDIPSARTVKRWETRGAERLAEIDAADSRWSVRFFSKRADLEREWEDRGVTPNTQGTSYYNTGTAAFLALVRGEAAAPDTKLLLHWGGLQYLDQRARIWFYRAAQPAGACVPHGFGHFLRWSHVSPGAASPTALGGISRSFADGLRKQLRSNDPLLPDVTALFDATPADFRRNPNQLYGLSVLFTEFLWDGGGVKRRRRYIRALKQYGASGRPVPSYPLDLLLAQLKPEFRSVGKLDAAFRAYVLEDSVAVNERKMPGGTEQGQDE